METVKVERYLSADENDILRDTDLAQAPGAGVVGIWAGSDQVDHLITVRVAAKSLSNRSIVPFRGTSAPVSEENEAPVASATVRKGDPIKIDLDVVAAGNTRIVALWLGNLG